MTQIIFIEGKTYLIARSSKQQLLDRCSVEERARNQRERAQLSNAPEVFESSPARPLRRFRKLEGDA
jgi:hypothetical protein